jgi:hypothetical protein
VKDFFLVTLRAIEVEIEQLEPQIARAKIENIYDFARLQGRLDGLDMALQILKQSYNDELGD